MSIVCPLPCLFVSLFGENLSMCLALYPDSPGGDILHLILHCVNYRWRRNLQLFKSSVKSVRMAG